MPFFSQFVNDNDRIFILKINNQSRLGVLQPNSCNMVRNSSSICCLVTGGKSTF